MELKELKHHRKLAVENLYFRKEGKDYWRAELNIINQLIDDINATRESKTY